MYINTYSLRSLGSRLAIVNEEVKIILEQPQFICSIVLDYVGLSEITGPTSVGFRLGGCSLGVILGSKIQEPPFLTSHPSHHISLSFLTTTTCPALSLHLCVRVKLYVSVKLLVTK